MGKSGWIGVDLDSTATYMTPEDWRGPLHIGPPIPRMIQRIRQALAAGHDVRIFTARVCGRPGEDVQAIRRAIARYCLEHVGQVLPITNAKDWDTLEIWDDRAVGVEPNTGRLLSPSRTGLV